MHEMSLCYAYDPIEQIHNQPGHVENNRRTAAILARLREHGVLGALRPVALEPANEEQLLRVHHAFYLQRVQNLDEAGGGMLDPDTYVTSGSYRAALMSAGAAMAVTRAVMQGEASHGVSLMRPPGHHALPGRGMGFCIFANAALAVRAAQAETGLERALILDWDVHHGNGTEAIFYQDPTVAYVSLHQYPLYPGTGAVTDIGAGPGQGTTLNIPLPPGVGDPGYLQTFDQIIVPFARRFRPQLILVSAGYDAHWRDPLAHMRLTTTGYAQLARRVKDLAQELCDGRLVVLLEGGYDLTALSYSVLNTLLALMGKQEVVDPLGPAPGSERDIQDVLHRVKSIHKLG